MFRQNQILRTLSKAQSQARLDRVLADARLKTRTAIARRVCTVFDFVDARGQLQVTSCAKALSKLADRGRLTLPAPTNHHAAGASPRLLKAGVPMPKVLPDSVHAVEDLSLIMVTDDDQRAVWNTLLHQEHPRGATMFFGAQVRYLVHSAQGYLGAVGFSASALRLAARERWMAWSDAQRQAHLHRVVCLSRFLIRGRCTDLASHVLGLVLSRLSDDFEARYEYRPWIVETYVDPHGKGTCFKVANFQHIGHTVGGTRKTDGDAPEPPKALYVYELDRGWRKALGVPVVELHPVRAPHEALDSDQWAEAEFGGAPLGNRLRSTRLVRSASMLASVIGQPITGNTDYDCAAVKAHYRFVASDPASKVTPENILAPHRARTIERMRSQKVVLCIQDGSRLRYATRPACTDLEVVGRNQTKAKTRGIHMHTTLATTADGLPLGVLHCSFRDPAHGPLKPKAQRWLDAFRDTGAAADQISRKIQVICIMDREGDSFALFDAQRRQDRVEILVRARHDRRLTDGQKLFKTLAAGPADGTVRIEIKKVGARPKSRAKPARPGRRYRIAEAEVRFRPVTLPATVEGAEPVILYGIQIREKAPPAGEEPILWYLLTSMVVRTPEEALQMLDYYVKRWRIEDFFRVLKSGCKVERLTLRTALRLERAIAIYCVIAWRLMVLTLLGRTVPELDATVFFTELELRFLIGYARRVNLPPPGTLQEAILLVAVLGGYQNRTRDGPPGHQIMWRGLERLALATLGYEVREAEYENPPVLR